MSPSNGSFIEVLSPTDPQPTSAYTRADWIAAGGMLIGVLKTRHSAAGWQMALGVIVVLAAVYTMAEYQYV